MLFVASILLIELSHGYILFRKKCQLNFAICELPSVFRNLCVLIELEVTIGIDLYLIHPTRPKYIDLWQAV